MKKGFTIAEVLITLAVIGVIATTALPALKAKVEQNKRNAAIRATYTRFNEAFRLAAYDLGYNPRCGYWNVNPYPSPKVEEQANGEKHWYYENEDGTKSELPSDYNGPFDTTHCKEFGEAIINRLGVVKSCFGNGVADGCIPEYEGNDTIKKMSDSSLSDKDIIYQTSGTGGYRKTNINTKNHMFVLDDGKIIVGYFTTKYFHPRYFAIDINGVKGPNRWGYDLFPFQSKYANDNQTLEMNAVSSPIEFGGVSASAAIGGTLK